MGSGDRSVGIGALGRAFGTFRDRMEFHPGSGSARARFAGLNHLSGLTTTPVVKFNNFTLRRPDT